ncbi:hypothetical protein [Cognatilysobacter terrigena]|uniref:hypothetical protein n=1 Tax=Cognatilysobacter terrigena TaxID=2488749 RepID=UPI00105F11C0|nr:hypothetical protein [Lysobacter terrigena]
MGEHDGPGVQMRVVERHRRIEREPAAREHVADDDEVHADGRVRIRTGLDVLRESGARPHRGEREQDDDGPAPRVHHREPRRPAGIDAARGARVDRQTAAGASST